MNDPKILLWDLETGYNVATIFSLFNRSGRLPYQSIQQERYIICGAYKTLGAEKVNAISLLGDRERFAEDPTDDYYVVTELYKVLEGADALVAHYGDKFDMKYFNARAIYHGLSPLPDIPTIDTYKIANAKFLFNSNKLDYLGQFLGVGRKIETTEKLWAKCFQGNRKAVQDMVTYNKQDVELLEDVYRKLAPWAQNSQRKLNMNHFYGDGETMTCPRCGGHHLHRRGYYYTTVKKFARFQCQNPSCGAWPKAPIMADGTIGMLR
jgi:hypothetical protein